jgi:hypothetical protein
MSIRKLFAILVAISVLFAPAFTSAGMALAAVPDHHAQMTEKGHCDPVKGEGRDKPADMSCCGAMCMAVAVTPAAMPLAKPVHGDILVASLRGFQAGIPAELATPPPRAS